MPTAHPTSKILLTGLLALTSLVAACGDDDDDVTAPDPDHPYCEHEREIDSHFEAAFSRLGEDASEADQRAAAQSAARSVVDAGIMKDAMAAAPDHLREDLELLSSNVRAAAAGDVDVFFTEESDAAGRRIDGFCGLDD